MPIMKKATAPPPTKVKSRTPTAGVFKSSIKKDPSMRRRPIESLVYGDEIWEPQIRKEKEIVVCFYPFTENNLRISTCGKFIIEKFNVYDVDSVEQGLLLAPEDLPKHCSWEVHWNLFYFRDPIADFKPPELVEQFSSIKYVVNQENCETFNDFNTVEVLANKVIELVKLEFLQDRQEKLVRIKENDEELRKQKELEESEEESHELDSGITNSSERESFISENAENSSNGEENKNISQEGT